MERLIGALRAHAGNLDRTVGQPRLAVVTSFNPMSYSARVITQPDGTESGWLPVASAWVGPGWGMFCPLTPGDQVIVLPQEGEAEHGLIVARLFSSASRPPSVVGTEMVFKHQSGAGLRLRDDGSVLVEGDLHVTGQIYSRTMA